MIPEIARPITAVKPKIPRNPSKSEIAGHHGRPFRHSIFFKSTWMRAVNRQPWFPREGHVDTVSTLIRCEFAWRPTHGTNIGQNISKISFQRCHQTFKNITWVLIMIPEIDRPITGVKTEISWSPSKNPEFRATTADLRAPKSVVQSIFWTLKLLPHQSLIHQLGLDGGVLKSDGWIRSISDFRPQIVPIVTASICASLGAGERVILLDTFTVLIKPYLQAK